MICKICAGENLLNEIYSHSCINVLKNIISKQKTKINNLEKEEMQETAWDCIKCK
jgi:hypothetical protein